LHDGGKKLVRLRTHPELSVPPLNVAGKLDSRFPFWHKHRRHSWAVASITEFDPEGTE
jgi:hypothetical protein